MIALVTQADGTSRGQPWVSYLLALALIGGFAWSQTGEAAARRAELDANVTRLVELWQEHPYLDLDPRLVERAGGDAAVEERRAEWLSDRRDRGLAVMPASIKRRTQRRFDEHVAETFAAISELPAWRHGVVDRDSPPATWLTHFALPATPAALAVGLCFVLCLGIALEGVWGPLLFAPFAVSAIALGGLLYGHLHGDLGAPWVGASGLTAALLGAYCVQAIRWPARILGAIAMPAWLMAIGWIGLELFVVRGLREPSIESVPVATFGVLFGFGVAAGLAMRALGVEHKLKQRDEKAAEVIANPVLDRAMAAHEKGRSDEAFDMLRAEIERHPRDRDLAIAMWTVCNGLGRPEEAIPGFLDVVRGDLKRRRNDEAIAHWKELAPALGATAVEPTLLVRLGEVLLDAGEPGEALSTLALAVDGGRPMPSPLAIRAVRVARDLDPGLTARAAARALEDPQLDPTLREEFQALSADIASGVAPAAAPAIDPGDAPTQPVLDAPAAGVDPVAEEEPSRDAFDTRGLDADRLDPSALSLDALSQDLARGLEPDAGDPGDSGERDEPEDALSRWNDPGLVRDLSAELPDEAAVLDSLDGEAPESATYDPTSYGSVDLSSEDDTTRPDAAGPSTDADAPAPSAPVPDETDPDLDIAASAVRTLRLLEGTPLEMGSDSIKIEVKGRGKTSLAFDRIDGLAVAAVAGLAARPVVVVDLILNWIAMDGEPLKVIRLQSDRFSPTKFASGAGSPLEALKSWLATLLAETGATPLPGADAVRGAPFAQYADLESYHRDVLMAEPAAS